MNGEFVQGAYNKYEHDYTERPDELLQRQLGELAISREFSQTGERRLQIERTMGHIAFELSERYREQKDQEIDEAWREHDGVQQLETES